MAKKTIMHLRRNREIGGSEKCILLAADKMDPSKYDVIVATFAYSDCIQVPWIRLAEKQGSKTDVIRPLGKYSPQCISELTSLLRNRRVDLLHTHDHKSTIAGILAARWLNIPVVSTVHGVEKLSLKTRLNEFAEVKMARFADKVIAVSGELRKFLIAEGVPSDKVVVIHNGVDVEKFRPRRDSGVSKKNPNQTADGFAVGIIGRLSIEKGHSDFLQAAAEVAARFPSTRFLIVGEGPLEGELRDLATKLGITDKVVFTGFRSDIESVIAGLDVVVMASKTEGTPMVLLEAMALAKPIVATRVGGIPEVIRDKETGILINAGDEKALSEAMISLLRDKERSLQIGLKARQYVEQVHACDKWIEKIEGIYEELLFRDNGLFKESKHQSVISSS